MDGHDHASESNAEDMGSFELQGNRGSAEESRDEVPQEEELAGSSVSSEDEDEEADALAFSSWEQADDEEDADDEEFMDSNDFDRSTTPR